jgi:hypothetical protein
MNEGIKHLAEPYLTRENYSRYGEVVEELRYEFYPDELEEFVTAIIDACAEVSRQHNLEVAERSHMVHRAIQKHFGVE